MKKKKEEEVETRSLSKWVVSYSVLYQLDHRLNTVRSNSNNIN